MCDIIFHIMGKAHRYIGVTKKTIKQKCTTLIGQAFCCLFDDYCKVLFLLIYIYIKNFDYFCYNEIIETYQAILI